MADGSVMQEQNGRFALRRAVELKCDTEQVCLKYDRLLWTFTRMPFLAGNDTVGLGYPVLIDTALPDFAAVTLDVVARRSIPSHLDPPRFALVDSLPVGDIDIRGCPAMIEDVQWQVRLLGIPVYRLSGWALGMKTLQRFAYLSFDNPHRELTIGRTSAFEPEDPQQWQHYPLEMENATPWVTIDIAGVPTRIVPDSGGGPHVILTATDWERIKPRLTVRRHRMGSFPTWGGFQPIDVYTVAELGIGPSTTKRAEIWVRRDSNMASTFGLGPFSDTIIVFDFKRSRLSIKKP